MKRITECKVLITWDDGRVEDITYHIPENLIEHMEEYLDLLEREANENL